MAKHTPKAAPLTRAGKAMRAAQAKPLADKAAAFAKPVKVDLAARREALHAALRKAMSVSAPSQVVEKIDMPGGDETEARKPVTEQVQGVEAVTCGPAQDRKLTRNACPTPTATIPEKPADLSTKRRPAARKADSALTKQARNITENITAPRFTFPPFAEPTPPPVREPGTYPIAELRMGQCRFACTPHGVREHRFCGAATEIGPGNPYGSWCAAHLTVVTAMPGRTPGGASRADVVAKEEVA